MAVRPQSPQAGSSTQTEEQEAASQQAQQQRLRLVGSPEPVDQQQSSTTHVTWAEDTVDNENLNRKKSKICCIFHPTKEFGESSEEEDSESESISSSSSSSSDSDSESDSQSCSHHHHHHRRRNRPNAYERLPKIKR